MKRDEQMEIDFTVEEQKAAMSRLLERLPAVLYLQEGGKDVGIRKGNLFRVLDHVVFLCGCGDESDRLCYAKQRSMADRLFMSWRTVRRCLKFWVESGVLAADRRGLGKTNEVWVCWSELNFFLSSTVDSQECPSRTVKSVHCGQSRVSTVDSQLLSEPTINNNEKTNKCKESSNSLIRLGKFGDDQVDQVRFWAGEVFQVVRATQELSLIHI